MSAAPRTAADAALAEGLVRPGTTVVVGAAQGIGAEVARQLARAAWTERVVLADVDGVAVDALAGELGGTGVDVTALRVDITDPDAVAGLVAASADAERVAIVAGTFAPAPALDVEREQFRRIVDVNLHGVFFVAQAYAREMAAREGGAIAGVASIAARLPRMRQAAYCASKAGMRQALRVLGMEVAGRGVRINTVSPGATDTPMMRTLASDHASVDSLAQGSLEAMRPRIPDGRVATPGTSPARSSTCWDRRADTSCCRTSSSTAASCWECDRDGAVTRELEVERVRRLLVACALLCAVAVVGCGGSSGDGGSTSASGPVTIKFWHGQNDITQKALERLVAQFNRTHSDVKVDVNSGGVLADEMLTKLTASLAGGTYPDVAYVFGSDLANIARSDKVQDLTDAVRSAGLEMGRLLARRARGGHGRGPRPRGARAGGQPRHHLQQEALRRGGRPLSVRRLELG